MVLRPDVRVDTGGGVGGTAGGCNGCDGLYTVGDKRKCGLDGLCNAAESGCKSDADGGGFALRRSGSGTLAELLRELGEEENGREKVAWVGVCVLVRLSMMS